MPPRAPRSNDDALVRRAAGGDRGVAAIIDGRYRRPLTRYARGLLGRSDHDAEDVVQDVLVRAHEELAAGRGPDELRPWLYRLTRNRAIDEMRRARWGEASLEMTADGSSAGGAPDAGGAVPSALHDLSHEPETVRGRREALRELMSDLADLPVNQRAALLAREVDGEPSSRVGERLGVSTEAAQMLVVRARASLTRARDARVLDARLRLLAPPPGILAAIGLGPAVSAKVLALVGAATATTAAAVTAGVVVSSHGIDVVSISTARTGAPAPLTNAITPGTGPIKRGDRLPPGISFVVAKVTLPMDGAIPRADRDLTLRCPDGQRFAALLTTRGQYLQTGYTLRPFPEEGVSREATFRVGARGSLGIMCRHLDDPAALARRTAALQPAPPASVPHLRRPIVLERVTAVGPDSTWRRGELIVTVRLSGPVAAGADGWELYADRRDGDVHHLAVADFSTAGGQCYEYRTSRRIVHWHPGLRTTVRLWIGDGRGRAQLVERSLAVPRPRPPSTTFDARRDSATGRLGCFSPHL